MNVADHRYAAPPLVEAIYEVYFADGPGWSQLSYKRLEDKFAPRFSGPRDNAPNPVGVRFQVGPDGLVATGPAPTPPLQRRMWRDDRSELFQFSPLMCAYNVLSQRYRSFEDHAPDIEELYGAYIAEAQPAAVQFVGQRYINRVVLPAGTADPTTYFEVYPKLPTAILHRPFALQVVADRFEGGEVALNLAYQGDDQGKAVFFLDVYARSTGPLPPVAHDLRMWHERAHPYVHRSFEAALTMNSRQLFDRVEP